MAYVFQSINNSLRDGSVQKQNIFDPTQNPNAQAPQDGGAFGADSGGGIVKTSSDAELGGPGSGGSSAPKPQVSQAKTATDPRLMNNKTTMPTFTAKAQADISSAENALQNEANSYVKGQQKSYAQDTATLDKAIGGDAEAQGKVRGLSTQMALPVEKFNPQGDYDIEDIKQLQTDEGTRNLLKRGGDAAYNKGEAAFDMMLLGRTPEFNQIRSSLQQRQADLTKQRDALAESKTQEAAKARQDALDAAKAQQAQYLGSKQDEILALAKKDQDRINAERAALRKSGNAGYAETEAKKVLADLQAGYAGSDINYWDLGGGDNGYLYGVDPSQFYGVNEDVGIDYGFDDSRAQTFNTIEGLLGRTGVKQGYGDQGRNDRFDSEGYKAKINEAVQELQNRLSSEKANQAKASAALLEKNAATMARSKADKQKAAMAEAAKKALEEQKIRDANKALSAANAEAARRDVMTINDSKGTDPNVARALAQQAVRGEEALMTGGGSEVAGGPSFSTIKSTLTSDPTIESVRRKIRF